ISGIPIRAVKVTGLRYERPAPGDLVHVDVKKIGRIPDGGGWRAHGRGERPWSSRRVGFDYVHAAVDDHTRMAYAEILPDEKGATTAGFLLRANDFFTSHGIHIREVISDNHFSYRRSADFRAAVADIGAVQRFIKPHCPWQNGKVERFNRTLATEWAYRQLFTSNDQRSAALGPWLNYYNNERNHHGIGGNPPITRVLS
ncbi:MAG: integrase core domain-containing protein, partial [Candidatus Nanopelagicales bacterium]